MSVLCRGLWKSAAHRHDNAKVAVKNSVIGPQRKTHEPIRTACMLGYRRHDWGASLCCHTVLQSVIRTAQVVLN